MEKGAAPVSGRLETGAVPFSGVAKGTVPLEKGAAPVSGRLETGAVPFSGVAKGTVPFSQRREKGTAPFESAKRLYVYRAD